MSQNCCKETDKKFPQRDEFRINRKNRELFKSKNKLNVYSRSPSPISNISKFPVTSVSFSVSNNNDVKELTYKRIHKAKSGCYKTRLKMPRSEIIEEPNQITPW